MDSRVDALLAKLSHPLPAVRRRSLENLAFKVSSGLIPAARVVSDVAATRALVRFLEDPAAPEVQDVLRIVQLIAAKDSWSAAVLVDAGALDLVQALMNTTKVAAPAAPAAAPSATSSAAATPSRSRAQRVSTPTASPILGADDTKLARELIKVLLRVPPEQLRSLATPVVAPSRGNNKSVASPGRKIGSPVRGGSKAPDAPMLSSASSSSSSFSSSSSSSIPSPISNRKYNVFIVAMSIFTRDIPGQ